MSLFVLVGPSVLCFVQWTDSLTEKLQQQWQSLIDINLVATFLYIGGEQSSAIRTYPGEGRVLHPFDVRNEGEECVLCVFVKYNELA